MAFPDYAAATDEDVKIIFRWNESAADVGVVYEVTISEVTESTGTTNYTSTANFTTRLRFNITYLITVYASRCNGSLRSDPLITNITVHMNASETVKDVLGESLPKVCTQK